MEPDLPASSFQFVWALGIVLSVLPVVTTVLIGLVLREAVRIRRALEKQSE